MKNLKLALAVGLLFAVQPAQADRCVASASAPTYDANGFKPLSCDTSGGLRVTASGTGTSSTEVQGPVADGSADTAAKPVEVGGTDGTNIQTIKTDSTGSIQVDVEGGQAADGAAVSGNPIRIGGKDSAGLTQDVIASTLGAVGVARVSGVLLDPNAGETLTVKVARGTVAGSGDNAIVTAVAGKKIRVISYRLQARGTVVAEFQDTGTATGRDLPWSFQDREGSVVPGGADGFLFETGDGIGLDLNLSAAITTGYAINYIEVE